MISTISPPLSGSWFGFSLLMVCLPLNLGYKDHCISTLAHYFQLCFQRLAYGHDCLVEKGFGFDGQFIKVLKGNRVLKIYTGFSCTICEQTYLDIQICKCILMSFYELNTPQACYSNSHVFFHRIFPTHAAQALTSSLSMIFSTVNHSQANSSFDAIRCTKL